MTFYTFIHRTYETHNETITEKCKVRHTISMDRLISIMGKRAARNGRAFSELGDGAITAIVEERIMLERKVKENGLIFEGEANNGS